MQINNNENFEKYLEDSLQGTLSESDFLAKAQEAENRGLKAIKGDTPKGLNWLVLVGIQFTAFLMFVSVVVVNWNVLFNRPFEPISSNEITATQDQIEEALLALDNSLGSFSQTDKEMLELLEE